MAYKKAEAETETKKKRRGRPLKSISTPNQNKAKSDRVFIRACKEVVTFLDSVDNIPVLTSEELEESWKAYLALQFELINRYSRTLDS